MSVLGALRFAVRESRGAGGRLVFLACCLALGVAAISGVASLSAAVEDAIRARSRDLLGGDLAVSARRPLPPELDLELAKIPGAVRADARELATMLRVRSATRRTGGTSRLVDLVAVGAGYPFHGAIVLEPPGRVDALGADEIAVAPEAIAELGLAIGDVVEVGGATFTLHAAIVDEPGRLGISFRAGPRAYVTLAGLERTDLGGTGSRVRYRALIAVPPGTTNAEIARYERRLERDLPDAQYLSVETANDAQPAIRRSLDRVGRYLGLAALFSLLLGGVGVAQIVRAWVATRTQAVAVLRAIGYRPGQVLALLATNVALLAFVASLVGALLGTLLPLAIPPLVPELIPSSFELRWQWTPVPRSTLLGVGIALCFALPPLVAVWRIPPARVLRAEAEPVPAPRAVTFAALALVVVGIFGSAWAQAESPMLAAWFTAGVGAAAVALWLFARALTALAARVPREKLPAWLGHGVAALARPGAGAQGAIVALGLGVLVVAAMALVETRLADRLRNALPPDAPSVFLLDVQPGQQEDVLELFEIHHAVGARIVPVVTARLSSIDGVDVRDLAQSRSADERRDGDEPRRPRWVLTREQRLTWLAELPSDNVIVEGALWSDPEHAEMSLEKSFAEDMGAKLGTKLVFDVQGVPIETVVTSIRTVEWESFSINFFLTAEPGVFDEAPHLLLAAGRLPPESEQAFQDELAEVAPNVTPIRVRSIVERVLEILGKLAVGVRMLGAYTVLVGLAILAGVAGAAAVQRAREVALLKSLGVRRTTIAGLFATEYGLLGAVAGLIGGLAAAILAWAFLTYVVEAGTSIAWWTPLASAAGAALLTAACGLLASTRALRARPIETLRG